MPQFAQYRVSLLDWDGSPVTQLFPGDDFLSITWSHKRNEPGEFTLQLVAETGTKDLFRRHYQVLIERNWSEDPQFWYDEFIGFHLGYVETWPTTEVDEHYWQCLGLSPEWMIDQNLLQPLRNEGNETWIYYDNWWAFDTADNVIKMMVSENLAAPVDTTRTLDRLGTQGHSGEGTEGCYEGSWVRLADAILDTIGEDGSRGNCDYRVERVSAGGGYEFRTYAPFYGVDRRRGNADGRKPVIFSMAQGNVANIEKRVIWGQAVTAAYGGWQGGGMERTIYERTNDDALAASPYARREEFYDLRDLSSPDAINGYLDQKLIDDGEQTYVKADILQTDASLYGRDYWWGDLATLDLPDGSTYDVRVTEMANSLNPQDEERITGLIEVWTRAEVVT